MNHFVINSRFEIEIQFEQQLLGKAELVWNNNSGKPDSLKIDGQTISALYLVEGSRIEVKLVIQEIESGQAVSLLYSLRNLGSDVFTCPHLSLPRISLNKAVFTKGSWTMQGPAVHWGQDFAFPLSDHERENYLGHLQDAEGGGIPLVYFWNKELGLALMQIEPQPQDWALPVHSDQDKLTLALEPHFELTLQPGQTWTGVHTVIAICHGDFFEPLALYRRLMAAQGIQAPETVPADFEPAWCSWGYEFDIQPAEMLAVLPALQELDIRWLTLDDRWFDAYGDWNPRQDTFPGGGDTMREMNERIHQAGAFSQLWWFPLCVEDGHGDWESHTYGLAKLYQDHPDWVILNREGQVARNNRHLAMLCPSLLEVQNYIRQLTLLFIQDWGFDGHKLDNIYTIPACYNPAHHHQRPQESSEAMSEVYRIIFETTRSLRPNSVTQICPCGTPISMQLLPWTDQTVTADPTTSQQIRQRIKFYKALSGPQTAVFADHVELSDGGLDFASEIGSGGVPATKFVWPEDAALKTRLKEYWNLSPEKQIIWKKWFSIYNQHRLAEGEYLNLYDLAFDLPETHAIRKQDRIYYAFFQDHFQGEIQLRGLEQGSYRILDYVNQIELGQVDGSHPRFNIEFDGSLLLVAIPDELNK